MNTSIPGLVEHLFRHEAGRLLSGLGRRLGAAHFDLAEETVQDALVKALKVWPYQGVPENPAAWLGRVAHNLALDKLRRNAIADRVLEQVAADSPVRENDSEHESEWDDQLAMIFACCHPSLAAEARVALTLKAVCGFGTGEVARAFLIEETAVAQRIVRAKRLLRDENIPIAVPPPADLAERLDSVLQVLYLLFNEGYAAHAGDDLVRHDLCEEALRLGRLLTYRPDTARPKVHALVALMFFHAARLPGRVDGSGHLLVLAEQDRTLWDRRLMFAGLRHLENASEGHDLSSYHLEAGIAAIHVQAPSDEATDWSTILWLYDRLEETTQSPVVKLNRAVAVMRLHGPERGLEELESTAKALDRYYLLHSVRGDFLRRLGRNHEAIAAYRAALTCPCCTPERRFLEARLVDLTTA